METPSFALTPPNINDQPPPPTHTPPDPDPDPPITTIQSSSLNPMGMA